MREWEKGQGVDGPQVVVGDKLVEQGLDQGMKRVQSVVGGEMAE